MTFTVSPWLVWAVCSLALFGLVFCWRVARGLAGDALERWRDWRAGDDQGTDEDADPLEELPPEQSAEDLGFLRGYRVELPLSLLEHADRERQRRAPWEVDARAAYESLGFDYPSGLMARVRELTP